MDPEAPRFRTRLPVELRAHRVGIAVELLMLQPELLALLDKLLALPGHLLPLPRELLAPCRRTLRPGARRRHRRHGDHDQDACTTHPPSCFAHRRSLFRNAARVAVRQSLLVTNNVAE